MFRLIAYSKTRQLNDPHPVETLGAVTFGVTVRATIHDESYSLFLLRMAKKRSIKQT